MDALAVRQPVARGECSWIAAAMSSLPVPLSPVMSTDARDAATCSTVSNTFCIGGLEPTMFWMRKRSDSRARSWPASRLRRRRSSARSMTMTSSSTLIGLVR